MFDRPGLSVTVPAASGLSIRIGQKVRIVCEEPSTSVAWVDISGLYTITEVDYDFRPGHPQAVLVTLERLNSDA